MQTLNRIITFGVILGLGAACTDSSQFTEGRRRSKKNASTQVSGEPVAGSPVVDEDPAYQVDRSASDANDDVVDQPVMVGGAFLTMQCGDPTLNHLQQGEAALGCRAKEPEQNLQNHKLQATALGPNESWAVKQRTAPAGSAWQVELVFPADALGDGRMIIKVADGDAQVVALNAPLKVLNPQIGTTPPPPADWWSTDWLKRRKLTLDVSGFAATAENLTDFPVLVRLAANDPAFRALQSGGQDLRFFDAKGAALTYEIEQLGEASGALIWVRVATLETRVAGRFIWMYYGNNQSPPGASAAAVWDASFIGVYHFASLTRDSKRGLATTNVGATAGPGAVGEGVIVGDGRYLEITEVQALPKNKEPATACGYAVMTFVKDGTQAGTNQFGWIASWGQATTNRAFFIGSINTTLVGGGYGYPNTDLAVANFWAVNQWRYICQTYDGTRARLYADGVLVLELDRPDWNVNTLQSFIGRQVNTLNEYWPGRLDELRISRGVRSGTWIIAEHMTMTGKLVKVEAEETLISD